MVAIRGLPLRLCLCKLSILCTSSGMNMCSCVSSPAEISHSQATWSSLQGDDQSETAVFIEPTEGAVTRVSLRPDVPHQIIRHGKRPR